MAKKTYLVVDSKGVVSVKGSIVLGNAKKAMMDSGVGTLLLERVNAYTEIQITRFSASGNVNFNETISKEGTYLVSSHSAILLPTLSKEELTLRKGLKKFFGASNVKVMENPHVRGFEINTHEYRLFTGGSYHFVTVRVESFSQEMVEKILQVAKKMFIIGIYKFEEFILNLENHEFIIGNLKPSFVFNGLETSASLVAGHLIRDNWIDFLESVHIAEDGGRWTLYGVQYHGVDFGGYSLRIARTFVGLNGQNDQYVLQLVSN